MTVGDNEDEEAPKREIVTTSPLEDWLWRGKHPVVKDMSWYVYSMWVFRIEKPPPKRSNSEEEPKKPYPRFIDIEFQSDYKLFNTHLQRIATEFRVPKYDGFTMPSSTYDSETAAMYKSLLLRPLSVVEPNGQAEDLRFAAAFDPLCTIEGQDLEPHTAFTRAWCAFVEEMEPENTVGRFRFLGPRLLWWLCNLPFQEPSPIPFQGSQKLMSDVFVWMVFCGLVSESAAWPCLQGHLCVHRGFGIVSNPFTAPCL